MLRMNNRIALGSNLGKSIGNGTTSRYMSDLDGTADYYTIPTVELTGDFELSFYTDSKSVNKITFSDSSPFTLWIVETFILEGLERSSPFLINPAI